MQLAQLVHHQENGFLFEPGNSQEMAKQFDHLLGSPELQRKMGTRGLEIIASHERVKVLEEWETLYCRLADEFIEAKERRQRLRLARKNPNFQRPATHSPRIMRTGS